jgi:autotransporter-associated beta strand protein
MRQRAGGDGVGGSNARAPPRLLECIIRVSGGITFAGDGMLQADAPLTLPSTRTVTINSGATAAIDSQGYSVSIAGNITGPGKLKKTGAGTLTLAGSNSYSGDTELLGGILLLTNFNALADSTLNYDVGYSGLLQFGPSGTYFFGGLRGDRSLTFSSGLSEPPGVAGAGPVFMLRLSASRLLYQGVQTDECQPSAHPVFPSPNPPTLKGLSRWRCMVMLPCSVKLVFLGQDASLNRRNEESKKEGSSADSSPTQEGAAKRYLDLCQQGIVSAEA